MNCSKLLRVSVATMAVSTWGTAGCSGEMGGSFDGAPGEVGAETAGAGDVGMPDQADSEELDVVEGNSVERVLAKVELEDGSTVTFLADEEEGELLGLGVLEEFSLDGAAPLANPSPADATKLELLAAISDQPAPAELIAEHQREAILAGRAPEEIREVSFDRTTLKGSYSPSKCTEVILRDFSTNSVMGDNTPKPYWWDRSVVANDGSLQYPTGSNWRDKFNMGICADSVYAEIIRKNWYRRIGTSTWSLSERAPYTALSGKAARYSGGPSEGFEWKPVLRSKGADYHWRTGWGTIAVP